MDRTSIEIRKLDFSYGGKAVLRGVNLDIDPGELFAVLSPSGSGKTTLLRLLAGLEQPAAGAILFNGKDVRDIVPARRPVGVVFQDFALWPHMSVFDNVAFGVVEQGGRGEAPGGRVGRVLDLLDIAETRDFRPDRLSVGQQQRVALARALVTEPRVLLLDDPFSNLEYELRVQMRRDLCLLQRRLGITVILVTHHQEDALSISDRLAVVARGTVLQVGTPAAVVDFPASVEVARFVGVSNLVPGTVRRLDGQTIEFSSPDIGYHRWPLLQETLVDGTSVLSIRPHALHIAPIDTFRDGRYLWLEGRIRSSEFLGDVVRYQVDVGAVCLSVNQAHYTCSPVQPHGTPVLVGFDPSRARLFAAPDGSASVAATN